MEFVELLRALGVVKVDETSVVESDVGKILISISVAYPADELI